MSQKKNSENIAKFKKNGYILIEGLLSEKKCDEYISLLENYYNEYSKKYATSQYKSNDLSNKLNEKVIYNLHNKSLKWFEIFENKKVLEIIKPILQEGSYKNSEPFYLSNISARCPVKKNKGQILHVDANLPGCNYILQVNALWMLDNFTKTNGSTRIVPNSHRFKSYANEKKKYKEKIITGNRGSVLIFDGNLWHGGSEKKDQERRWSIILGYTRWFIKPSFDYFKNTPIKFFNKMNANQKELLGFRLAPPKDEFTRVRRLSNFFESPNKYQLP